MLSFNILRNKETKITVLGLGRAGKACVKLLKNKGFEVIGVDMQKNSQFSTLNSQPFDAELIVASPGIALSHPVLQKARKENIPVIGELEMASRFVNAKIIAVTGTNGKTVTCYLIHHILKIAGINSVIAGNMGIPLSSVIEKITDDTIVVLEVSTFQLERIEKFRPYVGILLNISPDHLDRHKDFNEYKAMKGKLFMNQTEDNFGIFNFDDEDVFKISRGVESRKFFFSRENKQDAYISEDNKLFVNKEVCLLEEICNLGKINFNFECVLEDIMAASLATFIIGIPKEKIRKALISFKGVEHRLEFVGTKDGVRFINNSMCTNPDSFVKTLYSFKKKPILIAGGKEKGIDSDSMIKAIKQRTKYCILIGEVAEKINVKCKMQNVKCKVAENMNKAVKYAFSYAKSGNTVLLSPGFASFDQFRDFAERGEKFKKAVKSLELRV